ncbi:MAG TPA: TolC family protein [Oligoflexia bacterium]|nr:TolC family protein [Oligoflexia bacterium]HMP49528.1 TolC family protein [Oligoflexia bacterium]
MHIKIISIAIIVSVSGCSLVNTTESFKDIQLMTDEKIDSKIIWNQDEEKAKEIELAVNNLLTKTLSVSDAVQIALLNSPSLQAIYEEVGVAQADLVQAGLLQNPVFDISRRFPGKAFELDIAQDFVDLLFIPLRTKVAENALQATKRKVASEIIKHAAKTKLAYYELQAHMQELEMLQAVSQAMDASALAAKKIFQAGNIIALEMQNEQNLANDARIDLAMAENDVIQERERLNVMMGLWGKNINWKIEKRLPNPLKEDPDGTGLERLAIFERLDLAAERKELDAFGNNINLTGYGAMISEALINIHSETEPDGNTTRGPSILFPIPIFNQGNAQRAKAIAMFRQKAADFMQHSIEIRSEVRATYNKMRTARKRTEFYQREVLPLKAKILEQTQLQYNGMFMSVFQLLQTKRDQIEAGKNFIDSLKDYWLARTELELAVGGRIQNVPIVSMTSAQSEVLTYPDRSKNNASMSHQHHHGE